MLPSENLEKLYPNRKIKLEKILRYHAFDTMFYRTNDWIHSLRVRWLAEELLPVARSHFKNIDSERATCLALVHDDAEMIMGDVQAGHKAIMSPRALSNVHHNEERAISLLAKRHPIKVDGKYDYGKLLLEIYQKKTVEAQLVSYADKLDGYCESLHEVYAGNYSLLRSILFYTDFFARTDKTLPKLKPMFSDKRSALTDLKKYLQERYIKFSNYRSFGKPFTMRSIKLPSQFPFYDRWRKITINRGGRQGLMALIVQREFGKW
ncbi:MAG TPA: YfbR-like 5'-deoxynucleotidase [Candidatus Paceibacterota bacterium]|jgi:5'-deoxynucleotidase YfbR-like HD superfamily hydrolase|nr:YfbR-like 5'-deoxynucleotidase [Candidatus Paceibacterota bacterium]